MKQGQRVIHIAVHPDLGTNIVVAELVGRNLQTMPSKLTQLSLSILRSCCPHRMSGKLLLMNGTYAVPSNVLATANPRLWVAR